MPRYLKLIETPTVGQYKNQQAQMKHTYDVLGPELASEMREKLNISDHPVIWIFASMFSEFVKNVADAQGSVLLITASIEAGNLKIELWDNGKGFGNKLDPNEQKTYYGNIIDTESKATKTVSEKRANKKDNIGGEGLGLSTIHQFLECLEGNTGIYISKSPGGGGCVELIAPLNCKLKTGEEHRSERVNILIENYKRTHPEFSPDVVRTKRNSVFGIIQMLNDEKKEVHSSSPGKNEDHSPQSSLASTDDNSEPAVVHLPEDEADPISSMLANFRPRKNSDATPPPSPTHQENSNVENIESPLSANNIFTDSDSDSEKKVQPSSNTPPQNNHKSTKKF